MQKNNGLNLEDIFSHEFKTPLAIILNNANNIERRYAEGRLVETDLQQTIASIRRCCNLLSMLSNNMALTVSESKKMKPKPILYDLAEQLHCICFMTNEMFNDKNIKINFTSKTCPAFFYADPSMILLIITNLISNGIKYNISQEKIIDIKLEINDGNLLITVHDNGIGIPKNDINKVCAKHFRSNNKANMPATGLGLGLYIVSEAVKAHGGKLKIASTEKGTTFSIFMPGSNKAVISSPSDTSVRLETLELCYADLFTMYQ